MIKITSNIRTNNSSQTVEPTINPDITFKDLNFSSNMVDWSNIKHELDEFDWQTEMKNVPVDEKYSTIIATTLKIVTKYAPLRKACYKAPIPRHRKAIMRKRSKLHSRIRQCNNDHDKRSMQDKVERLEEQLRKSHRCERTRDETHAVEAIQTNYKYFFKYVKKLGTVNAAVGPLVNTDGEVINNPHQICETLKYQYENVFSQPKEAYRINDPDVSCNHRYWQPLVLDNINFQPSDIVEAINELKTNSAAGPEEFPSILLKKCALELSIPLQVREHRIVGRVGCWIDAFHSDRVQFVAVGGCMSQESHVLSGVPQGSILGPILFLLLISDIDGEINMARVTSFADDTLVARPKFAILLG
ncbi:hypothetical protein Pmani_031243 [Petrolisthes manimaculis]|uniref:Reverse transcriptase domain-containing protein n=1 Tax=Petrolisthes manimaculis TaxID=1843537 RepID=A0AAE1NV37_9EUCA|nr:hypothetical protein Pmani_031243 [Petrolisthes manimaculis]